MKIVFDVEKRDETTGKTYYPGTEYEMSEEKAKSILSQTKHAHQVPSIPKLEKLTISEVYIEGDDAIEVIASEEQLVETVKKPKKKNKK